MPGLYRDAAEKRALEARNGVIQARAVIYHAGLAESDSQAPLSPNLVKEFQRLAINQIYTCAGEFRTGDVVIQGVDHKPPDWTDVPRLVDDMCAHILSKWTATPVHLASYAMWRINWIHPFFGGNGRTSRAVSYLVLCRRLGFVLPGEPTIPDQIETQREHYYAALRHADEKWRRGLLDLSLMEELLSSMLAAQLVQIHAKATGKAPPARQPQ